MVTRISFNFGLGIECVGVTLHNFTAVSSGTATKTHRTHGRLLTPAVSEPFSKQVSVDENRAHRDRSQKAPVALRERFSFGHLPEGGGDDQERERF